MISPSASSFDLINLHYLAEACELSSPTSVTQAKHSEPPEEVHLQEFVPPRSCNNVRIEASLVVKSSQSPTIRGELYFYHNIPDSIRHLFPKLHWHSHRKQLTSFGIDHIKGSTLSHLFVHNRLQTQHLIAHVLAIHSMHQCPPSVDLPHVNIYANYFQKVDVRYIKHQSVYAKLGMTMDNHFRSLHHRLLKYESQNRGRPVPVIHGDPVFTNVLVCDGALKYIDMRGAQGTTLTLCGDATYDLAKTYQSLCGYDFVLGNVKPSRLYLTKLYALHKEFHRLVAFLYPTIRMADILLATCSLFTSLIPLHDNEVHQSKFATLSMALLSVLESGQERIRSETIHALLSRS